MSEQKGWRLAWVFVVTMIGAAAVLFGAGTLASDREDDHEAARELRAGGDIVPLVQLLGAADLTGLKVLEAKLEHEDGRLVYELELLDDTGRVHERYYDAVTGQMLRDEPGD